jgi:MFS family permease
MGRLVAFVSAIIFVDALLFSVLTPLVPDFADEFGLSKAGAGLLVGAYGAGALFGGIPGGLVAARFGPKVTVVGGLVMLSLASFGFALAGSAFGLGSARFVQGVASTATWAGSLAWLSLGTPRERRGDAIGTSFGAAVFGTVLGPVGGALAESVSVRASFTIVGVVTLGLAAAAALARAPGAEPTSLRGVGSAFRDRRFVGGLWLNTLPALLFGLVIVLTPLALDDAGWSTYAIAFVFFTAGLIEVVLNPLLGRLSDRIGRLRPIRFGLSASIAVAIGLAAASRPALIAVLICAASLSFGVLFTPGIALTSHRADAVGVAQGVAFGLMNTAWALGEVSGPTIGGALAQAYGDAVPYVACAVLCLLTLGATYRVAGRLRPYAA